MTLLVRTREKKMLCRVLVIGFALTVGMTRSGLADADVVAVGEVNQRIVTVNNVTVDNGVVSGEIVNHSNQEVRDVELLIRHMWQWTNEFRPGNSDPGMASYRTVKNIIRPGESARFTFNDMSTLPARTDGQFQTMVSVTGFTEIVRNR